MELFPPPQRILELLEDKLDTVSFVDYILISAETLELLIQLVYKAITRLAEMGYTVSFWGKN